MFPLTSTRGVVEEGFSFKGRGEVVVVDQAGVARPTGHPNRVTAFETVGMPEPESVQSLERMDRQPCGRSAPAHN